MVYVNRVLSCFTIAIFLLSACHLSDKDQEQAVVAVGSRRITPEELKRDIRRATYGMEVNAEEISRFLEPIVESLIDRYLILEYGKEEGILLSAEELDAEIRGIKKGYPEKGFLEVLLKGYVDFEEWKEDLRENLLIKKIIRRAMEGLPPVSSQEIKAFYQAHRAEFRTAQMVKFRQIVTGTREDAEKVIKKLGEGADMAQLAAEYSIIPLTENTSETGWIAKGDLEEAIDKVIFSLPVGKISPLVETHYGFHVFQVLASRQEGLRSLPEAMGEIEQRIYAQKEEAFYKGWLEELRDRYPVTVNQELLRTMELG